MPEPDLSVIVVTHNGRELALRTLRSALAAANGVDAEWFVVDSGSSDGTPDAVEREFPRMRVLRRENLGFAAGNNAALRLARGRHVLLLNPDVEVREGTLHDLVRALDARPGVGAASVVQVGPDGRLQHSIRRAPSPLRALAEALRLPRTRPLSLLREEVCETAAYGQETPAAWLTGAFLAVRGEALRDVGELDERFFLYSEETDWCHRIRAAGWEVAHLPVMTIVHHMGGYARPDLAAQLSWSKLLFARKHLSRPRAAALGAALVLRHLLRAVAFAPVSPFSSGARTRAAGDLRALGVLLRRSAPPFSGAAG